MAGQRTRRRIPEATVARLPVYLRILSEQFAIDVTKISSEELDIDDAKVGAVVGGVRVRHVSELTRVVAAQNISIGVIATPGIAAQDAADALVAAGVTSILNFAPTVINVPHGISVGKVDLAVELQILAYHEQRRINAAKGSSLVSVPGESRRGASA